jgi:hypothetical protein
MSGMTTMKTMIFCLAIMSVFTAVKRENSAREIINTEINDPCWANGHQDEAVG